MEILTVGQKIKRERSYHGYTLKHLCGDKISVSKLSCIENDKIEPEEWLLKDISVKLNIDYNELVKGVGHQIDDVIKSLSNSKVDDESISRRKGLLESALEHSLNTHAIQIIHELFQDLLELGRLDECRDYIKKYYDLSVLQTDTENTYFGDCADYMFGFREYSQALNYYNMALKNSKLRNDKQGQAKYLSRILKVNYRTSNLDLELVKELENLYSEYKLKTSKELISLAIFYLIKDNLVEYKAIYNYAKSCSDFNRDFWFSSIANELYESGEYDKSLKAAEDTSDQGAHTIDITIIKMNIAYKKGNYLEAINYSSKVLNDLIIKDSVKKLQQVYDLRGLSYLELGETDKAEIELSLSLDLLKKLGDRKGTAKCYLKLAEIFQMQGRIVESSRSIKATSNISTILELS